MRRVLVVGASGAIGGAIARYEYNRGACVSGTYRSNPDGVPESVSPVRLDLLTMDHQTIRARTTPTRGRWSAAYIAAGDPSSRIDWPGNPHVAAWRLEAGHGLRELDLALSLRERVNGPIVIIGSSAALWTMPGASPYAATHGAMDGAARAWLAESDLEPKGHGARIRFSRPGIIWGPIWERLGLHPDDLKLVRTLSTSPARYARRVVRYADSGRRCVHAGTWDAVLSRWTPPAILEFVTAMAMRRLLSRRSGTGTQMI